MKEQKRQKLTNAKISVWWKGYVSTWYLFYALVIGMLIKCFGSALLLFGSLFASVWDRIINKNGYGLRGV